MTEKLQYAALKWSKSSRSSPRQRSKNLSLKAVHAPWVWTHCIKHIERPVRQNIV